MDEMDPDHKQALEIFSEACESGNPNVEAVSKIYVTGQLKQKTQALTYGVPS